MINTVLVTLAAGYTTVCVGGALFAKKFYSNIIPPLNAKIRLLKYDDDSHEHNAHILKQIADDLSKFKMAGVNASDYAASFSLNNAKAIVISNSTTHEEFVTLSKHIIENKDAFKQIQLPDELPFFDALKACITLPFYTTIKKSE
jgi:hypothetical protein